LIFSPKSSCVFEENINSAAKKKSWESVKLIFLVQNGVEWQVLAKHCTKPQQLSGISF
jgi:hypothetical protein